MYLLEFMRATRYSRSGPKGRRRRRRGRRRIRRGRGRRRNDRSFCKAQKKTFGDSHQQMIVLNPPYSARSLNRTPRPRLKLLRSPSLASTLALAALTLSTAAASRSSAARRRAAAAASREASRESNSRRRAALAWERSDSN